MERITFEIDNHRELKLLISIAEKLGIKRFFLSQPTQSKPTELQKIYQIIDKGADISSFGNIEEWQSSTRADRKLNFNKL